MWYLACALCLVASYFAGYARAHNRSDQVIGALLRLNRQLIAGMPVVVKRADLWTLVHPAGDETDVSVSYVAED